MKTADVCFDDTVHYLNLKDSKNRKGVEIRRQVPIHSELLRLGILDYVKACESVSDYLFPSLKIDKIGRRSAYMSEKISRHLLNLGLYRKDYPKLGAHYFRGSVITKFDNIADVQDKDWKRIVGHSTSNDVSIESYSGGLTLTRLQEIVELIDYEGNEQ